MLSSPVVADGDLFIASDNGHVYAFSDEVLEFREPEGLNAILIATTLLASALLVAIVVILVWRKKK